MLHIGANMQQFIDKAKNLIEALPYIRKYSGKIVVIKYGGAAMTDTDELKNVMRDIALLHFCGLRPVIVHGGGPEISAMCQQLNIPVKFLQGQRVTDEATLEVLQMTLLGKINSTLVASLNNSGVKAVGLSGQDAGFIQAKKLAVKEKNGAAIDLGYVGEVDSIDTKLITTLLNSGFLPVIAPLSRDIHGQAFNINADTIACAIAGALAAEKLVLLSDVNGLYADKNDPQTRVSSLDIANVDDWIQDGKISGGMIPKINACVHALNEGVKRVHILDGKIQHSLLLEIFTDAGVGTMITA